MSLFRKNALDALSSPEKLDEPLRLIKPEQWVLLVSMSGLAVAIVLWAIFGRLPIRVSGRGVLIRQNSITVVQSETSGRVQSLDVQVGQCLKTGQLVAKIEPVQKEVEQTQARSQVEQLINQDSEEDQLGIIRLRQLALRIKRVEGLAEIGALSRDELARRKQELADLKDSIAARDNQREIQITQQKARIKSLQEEIKRTSSIRSPINGCIIDKSVHLGEVVQPGTHIFSIESTHHQSSLESLAFFTAADGKRLSPGQRVRISPENTKPQRHGSIDGKILTIRKLPVHEDALKKRLGIESLITSFQREQQGPLIEISTSLQRDSKTKSGYHWGGGPGPDLQLTAGTPTSVRVLVEERQPISYVIPILRRLTGLF
tara:strand:- start:6911 stop:8032 length:1122 start_codon:yes stop_codon:yes gene_type:complete